MSTGTLDPVKKSRRKPVPVLSAAEQARVDQMVTENMGLAHAAAGRFGAVGLEYDDLFQIACVGLIKAARGFDPEYGVKFSTYAFPVIIGEIKQFLRDDGQIKVSRSVKELGYRSYKKEQELAARLGREPTVGEIAGELGVSPAEVVEAIDAHAKPMSLSIDTEDEKRQADIPDQDKLIEREQSMDLMMLKAAVHTLPPKERQLIALRFFSDRTQTEVARELGITQVQVSRLEKKIIGKLKAQLTG